MHHRHCADSSFHRSERSSERRAVAVSTDNNCLPSSSAGSTQCDHSIFTQFLQFCQAHTQNTVMMKTARDAVTVDRSFTQVPSTFCALWLKLDRRKNCQERSVVQDRN